VEDPHGRYLRRELIGTGAFKSVFKAYDSEEGIEVAWNQVRLHKVQPQQKAKILGEITILEQVKHAHIMEIYDSWETVDGHYVVFITEIMSMTLKDFVRKAKKVRLKNVKKWALQILQGLDYLHSHDPPIIHRDLKCDNVFMNTNRGEVKIGDLGLSICMKDKKFAVSVIGTPEFMAPELYEELYDEKVDIYAFGMCFLEMVTGDYPYSECVTAAQVYRKVTQGTKPEGIKKIPNDTVKDFIYLCLSHKDVRPSAKELMSHQLMVDDTLDDFVFNLSSESDTQERISEFIAMNHSTVHHSPQQPVASILDNEPEEGETSAFDGESTPLSARRITSDEDIDMSEPSNPFTDDASESVTRVVLVENSLQDDEVLLKLYLKLGHGYKEVKFPFHLSLDTPQAVAKEMVMALNLSDLHFTMIANGIADTLTQANLVSAHNGRITTITQAIEENNSQIIFTQTTVDPHASTDTTSTVSQDNDISKAVDMMLIDTSPTTQQLIEHELPSSISHHNTSIHLEMNDNKQAIPTTTLNTTTTVTVVPNPNPTNPNSILESLVDKMRNDVASTKGHSSGSHTQSPSSPQKTAAVQQEKPYVKNEEIAEPVTNPAKGGEGIKQSGTSQPLKIDIPTKESEIVSNEAFETWQKLARQHKEERAALEERHRHQREEFKKKFPTFVIPASPSHFEAPTPSSPGDSENRVTVIPTKKFSNLTNKVISDIAASISNDLSNNSAAKDNNNLITTTTIVNNLNKKVSDTGTSVYKIMTTSMQTTSSAGPGIRNLTLAQLRKLNGLPSSVQTPTTASSLVHPFQNKGNPSSKSTGQLDVNINLLLQNAPTSENKTNFESKVTGCDDLSSLISKNLTSLSLKTSNPVLQTHQHQHQIPLNGSQQSPPLLSSQTSVGKPSSSASVQTGVVSNSSTESMGPKTATSNSSQSSVNTVTSPTNQQYLSQKNATVSNTKFGTDRSSLKDVTGS